MKTTEPKTIEGRVQALFAQGGDVADPATLRVYQETAASFDADWMTAADVGAEFRYCESLAAAGVLETRREPIRQGNRVLGSRTLFRRAA